MVTTAPLRPAGRLGRPKAELSLTDEERSALERLARRRTSAQAAALRARIILSCATGAPNAAVAEVLGVAPATVGKWRRRFVAARLDGLFDEPRPGAPRTISDDQVEAVIVQTLEQKPKDATHWSTRSMAAAMGMSQSSISLIWRAFGLQPHRPRELQALDRPPLRREGSRRRWPVPRSTRAGGRA
jgi:transposase